MCSIVDPNDFSNPNPDPKLDRYFEDMDKPRCEYETLMVERKLLSRPPRLSGGLAFFGG